MAFLYSTSRFCSKKECYFKLEKQRPKMFFYGVLILRSLHPINLNDSRLTDLKQYENELMFKGIHFPVKIKDITKFKNQNPSVPGINVFSVSDNNKSYPLRMTQIKKIVKSQ